MVLLVDDVSDRVERLTAAAGGGLEIWPSGTFDPASYLARKSPFAVVMGLSSSHLRGERNARELRRLGFVGPIVALTSEAPVSGLLNAGVDAVLQDDAAWETIHSQVRAIGRRLAGELGNRIVIGDLAYDPHLDAFHVKGVKLALTHIPHQILRSLVEQPGRALGSVELERWANGKNLPFHILTIRRALSALGADGKAYVSTQHGRGYVLAAPAAATS